MNWRRSGSRSGPPSSTSLSKAEHCLQGRQRKVTKRGRLPARASARAAARSGRQITLSSAAGGWPWAGAARVAFQSGRAGGAAAAGVGMRRSAMSDRMHNKRRAARRNRSGGRVIEELEGRVLLAIINSLTDPLTGPGVDVSKWTITDRGLENNGPAGYNAPTEDATGLTL